MVEEMMKSIDNFLFENSSYAPYDYKNIFISVALIMILMLVPVWFYMRSRRQRQQQQQQQQQQQLQLQQQQNQREWMGKESPQNPVDSETEDEDDV
jgi:type II secretory pathway pseudopilin PulG